MLLEFLKSIRSGRKGLKGGRIGTLTGYLKRLAETVGEARLAKGLEIPEADLRAAIKNSAGKMVWFDPDNSTPAGFLKSAPTGGVVASGTLIGKADESKAMEAGSIMDFDCTVTTGRRDRDGDVLDPKGAILDPKMPLLWQHMPFQPIGRMVRALEQNDERVAARFMIASTMLGNDAAVLVEAGCLRISHGFSPIEYNPLKDDQGKDMGGWRISKYAMMETSLVSIPSNVDAEITQFSRGKLHHPLIKSWCKMLQKSQPRIVKGGFDGAAGTLNLTINLKGIGGVTPAVPAKPAAKADDDEEDDEVEEESELEEEEGKTDDAETDEKEDEAEAADDESEDESAEGGKASRALGELIDAARAMAKDATLPKEAQRRMGVVDGLLEDIEASIAGSADALAAAAKGRDLVGIFTAVSEMTTGCVSKLRGVCDELGRIASLADMPEGAIKDIGGLSAEADDIVNAVGMLSQASAEVGEDGEGDELDEPAEEGEAGDELNDVADDDEEDDEEFKADDEDEDDVEKDGADAEEAEADDDENPEVDDESNPGMPKTGRSADRVVDRLLGEHLTGKRLSPESRSTLRLILGDSKGASENGRVTGRSRRRSAN